MVAKLTELITREYPGMALNTAYLKIQSHTGIALATLQRVMSGHTGPSIDTLSDLAKHLGTTVAEILRNETDEEPERVVPFPRRPPGRKPPHTPPT